MIREMLSFAQRRAVLATGARLLESRQPQRQVYARVSIGAGRLSMPYGLDVVAIFRWPGLVEVTDRNTGELLARSLPGWPYVLDESATPHPAGGAL